MLMEVVISCVIMRLARIGVNVVLAMSWVEIPTHAMVSV